jgi:hypothetical protein
MFRLDSPKIFLISGTCAVTFFCHTAKIKFLKGSTSPGITHNFLNML